MRHVLIIATILISLISCKKEESKPQGLSYCQQVAEDFYEIRDANTLRIIKIEEERDAGIIMPSHADSKIRLIRDETSVAQSYWLSECPQN